MTSIAIPRDVVASPIHHPDRNLWTRDGRRFACRERPIMQAELTHIPVSPRTRNILLAIGLGLLLLIFWKAPTLPKLLLTGMAVALILSFPVKYLSKIIPRGIAIALVVIA